MRRIGFALAVTSMGLLGYLGYTGSALAKSITPDAGMYKIKSSQGSLLGNSGLEVTASHRKVEFLLEVEFTCPAPEGVDFYFGKPRPTVPGPPDGPAMSLKNGRFSLEGAHRHFNGETGEISGRFTSATKAVGTAKFVIPNPLGGSCESGMISFTATHVGK